MRMLCVAMSSTFYPVASNRACASNSKLKSQSSKPQRKTSKTFDFRPPLCPADFLSTPILFDRMKLVLI